MPTPTATFESLRQLHLLAAQRYPHEYLDAGLGAVGLFLHDPPKNAGYHSTPLNTVTFASIGVDGIHFGALTNMNAVVENVPIVMTIPMSFDAPNFIVGESLHEFLCLGCQHGFAELANMASSLEGTIKCYEEPPDEFFDMRAPEILRLMRDELSLSPWSEIRARLVHLQSRHLPSLELPTR